MELRVRKVKKVSQVLQLSAKKVKKVNLAYRVDLKVDQELLI
jgi:hypothetical protein